MSRPTKLTPELITKVAGVIKGGAYPSKAAVACGLSEATYYAYMARGRAEMARMAENNQSRPKASERLAVEFLEAVEQASAEIQSVMANRIVTAAMEGDWKAALAYLERTNREEWGRVNRTELTGKDGGAIQQEVKAVTDADLAALADQVMGISPVIPAIEAGD